MQRGKCGRWWAWLGGRQGQQVQSLQPHGKPHRNQGPPSPQATPHLANALF